LIAEQGAYFLPQWFVVAARLCEKRLPISRITFDSIVVQTLDLLPAIG
jgi:hypothetical protein